MKFTRRILAKERNNASHTILRPYAQYNPESFQLPEKNDNVTQEQLTASREYVKGKREAGRDGQDRTGSDQKELQPQGIKLNGIVHKRKKIYAQRTECGRVA